MTTLGFILDGLEAALALERELGVRSVEIDRALLSTDSTKPQAARVDARTPVAARVDARTPVAAHVDTPTPVAARVDASTPAAAHVDTPTPVAARVDAPPPDGVYDFVFLHDKPLVGDGQTMIKKITAAMGRTANTAPVLVEPPLPRARFYVVLGDRALKKWFPGKPASPGMWIRGANGEEALVTYSPNYFLRFSEVTPTVRKIKKSIWNSLQGLLQRLALNPS